MEIDPEAILTEFYPVGSKTRELLLHHGLQVARKALDIIDRFSWLNAHRQFVYEAAMLHDVGIGPTKSPKLGCSGDLPYICHGVEGRKMLEKVGLHRHGLVCERHVGVGICKEEIRLHKLPLPERDMVPSSIEERLVCYADKFFSKSPKTNNEKSVDTIQANLAKYGEAHVTRFLRLHRLFTLGP
jgi:uncharacterized protein